MKWKSIAELQTDEAALLTISFDLGPGPAVHQWRTHVGDHVQAIWKSFTHKQRVALMLDAEELASQEEWE